MENEKQSVADRALEEAEKLAKEQNDRKISKDIFESDAQRELRQLKNQKENPLGFQGQEPFEASRPKKNAIALSIRDKFLQKNVGRKLIGHSAGRVPATKGRLIELDLTYGQALFESEEHSPSRQIVLDLKAYCRWELDHSEE